MIRKRPITYFPSFPDITTPRDTFLYGDRIFFFVPKREVKKINLRSFDCKQFLLFFISVDSHNQKLFWFSGTKHLIRSSHKCKSNSFL
jgi:hypothetical protein